MSLCAFMGWMSRRSREHSGLPTRYGRRIERQCKCCTCYKVQPFKKKWNEVHFDEGESGYVGEGRTDELD